MGDLSEHFSRKEFECQCGCGFDTVDIELLEALETIRHRYMKGIKITSGCRCAKHNKAEGGADDSQHTKGRAADFKVKDMEPEEIYNFLCRTYPKTFGIGIYHNRIHIDSRQEKARWSA